MTSLPNKYKKPAKFTEEDRKPLTKEDRARLHLSGKMVEQAGLFRVSDEGARKLGFGATSLPKNADLSGIVFPYSDEYGKSFNARLRRDKPEIGANGKPENKYLSLYGAKRGLYWPPGAHESFKRDKDTEILLVEAEKSALLISEREKPAGWKKIPLAMGGCDGWRDSEETTLPELEKFAERNVALMLDANVATNPKVQRSETALAAHLTNLRVKSVKCYRVPLIEGVNGPDDFLAQEGDPEFFRLLQRPVEPWLDIVGESYEAYMKAPPPTFLIKQFLQTGGATFIGGLPGDGKTYALLSIVQSLLTGNKLFGYFTVPEKVKRCVYLSPEITLGSLHNRATKFGLDPYVKNRQLIIRTLTAYPEITLDDPAGGAKNF